MRDGYVAYPDLEDVIDMGVGPLSGSVEEISGVKQAYEQLGVSHWMFHISPYSQVSYERLTKSVQLYCEMNGSLK